MLLCYKETNKQKKNEYPLINFFENDKCKARCLGTEGVC